MFLENKLMNVKNMSKLSSTAKLGVAICGTVIIGASAVQAQTVTVLLRNGDPAPWNGPSSVIASIEDTSVNHVGGWVAHLTVRDSQTLWSEAFGTASGSNPAFISRESRAGMLKQAFWDGSLGFSNAGVVVYSAGVGHGFSRPLDSQPGFLDVLRADEFTLAIQSAACLNDTAYWSFFNTSGATGAGQPYWIGGVASVSGGNTERQGLFFGNAQTKKLLGGDAVPNLGANLRLLDNIAAFAFSAEGTNNVAAVRLDSSADSNEALVLNGASLFINTTVIRKGAVVSASGALQDERWEKFASAGVTEGTPVPRSVSFTATTRVQDRSYDVLVRNGSIVYRDGMTVNGVVLTRPLQQAVMNESGDIASIWKKNNSRYDVLFINDTVALQNGQTLDLGNNQSGVLTTFKGVSTLSLSDRDAAGNISAYVIVNVDQGPGLRRECLIRVTVPTNGPPNCAADWNHDGVVNSSDYFDFLTAFFADDADFNGDGWYNSSDLFDFLTAFFAGCA